MLLLFFSIIHILSLCYLNSVFNGVCVHVYVCVHTRCVGGMCAMARLLVLSLHLYVGSGDGVQVTRIGLPASLPSEPFCQHSALLFKIMHEPDGGGARL